MRAWPVKINQGAPVPTAFLDRDGVLNWNRRGTYITLPAQLKLYSLAAAALRLIARKGYRIVVLTNQSGVARGYMTMSCAKRINLKLVRELRLQGAKINAIYFCPHSPEDKCLCRKPEPGLITEALKDHPADLPKSFMVGDKKCDLDLARRAGLTGYLVLTGQWRSANTRDIKKGYRDLLSLARELPEVKRPS